MSDTASDLAKQFNDPDAKPVFVRAGSSIMANIGKTLTDILAQGFEVFDTLQEGQQKSHEMTLMVADSIDTISQYITEAVAGNACMGHVQVSVMNMFSKLPECYLDQLSAENFERNMGLQAQMLMTASTIMGPEVTQEARDKLVSLNKYFGHWEHAVIETNAAVLRLSEIEERFLDMAQASKFGGFGTAGTGNNPLIGILNEIRSECETLFKHAQTAHILHDHLQEHMSYYKAAVTKLKNRTADAPAFVPAADKPTPAP